MSTRPRGAVLQRVPIERALPSLAALSHKTVLDIAGSGKRKIDGSYAATRLSQAMTNRWANERFRQVMLLIRQFRMEWPNQSLLTADDMEFIRSAVDVALSSAAHDEHTGDIYDLNSTTWAIWMVQHVRAWFACDANHPIARAYSLPVRLGGCQAHSLTVHHDPRPCRFSRKALKGLTFAFIAGDSDFSRFYSSPVYSPTLTVLRVGFDVILTVSDGKMAAR